MTDFRRALVALQDKVVGGMEPSDLLDDAVELLTLVPPDRPDLLVVADEVITALTDGDAGALARLVASSETERAVSTASSDLPEWVDEGMLAEFADTQLSGLVDMERIALLGDPSAGDQAEFDRIVHTLKGEATTVGFDGLGALYHELEDLVESVGDRGLTQISNLLLDLKDAIGEQVKHFVQTRDPAYAFERELDAIRRAAVDPASDVSLIDDSHTPSSGKGVAVVFGDPFPAGAPPAAPAPPAPAAAGPDPVQALVDELGHVVGFETVDPEMIEVFAEFYDESSDALTLADDVLVRFESQGPDSTAVDQLFRGFHTMKGLSAFLDQFHIKRLAHATENLLDLARTDLAELTPHRMDLLFQSTAMTRVLLEAAKTSLESGSTGRVPDAFFPLLVAIRAAAEDDVSAAPSVVVKPHPIAPVESEPVAVAAEPPVVAAPSAPKAQATSNTPASDGKAKSRGAVAVRESIKVDLRRVDDLVETIGELVIMEAMLANAVATHEVDAGIRSKLTQVSKIVRALQRQGLALRMVPLRGVFQKMNRLVRDLARRSEKRIRLELSGQDAEMDRGLADRLGDPLLHMIRNAVDHGIEPPEERMATGKDPVGTLKLSAYHEGGNIIIELRDDGRGLDRGRIVEKAIERGLIDSADGLADSEVWDLIFRPGFSTAEAVTEISGRGVGMDVVRRTVEDLRGRISIESVKGQGTIFKFILPLTLAIIDGMLTSCGEGRYVIPTLAILETIQPQANQLHRFAGGQLLLTVRGEQLPVVDLAEVLAVPSGRPGDATTGLIVVVEGVSGRVGVLVDDVIGQQQVVIKQLDEVVNDAELFSGAAILSDGRVGLVLNPVALDAGSASRARPTPTSVEG